MYIVGKKTCVFKYPSNMHAQPLNRVRDVALCLKSPLVRETSQVLLAGGQVFVLGDLPFSPHLPIDWLKMSEIILTGRKTQSNKSESACSLYSVYKHRRFCQDWASLP